MNNKHLYPKGRANSASTIIEDKVYMFGGNDGNNRFNDLWIFNL